MIIKIKYILKSYYNWFLYYFNKKYRELKRKEAERRIKICESCEYFWKFSRNCIICGCFCDVKVMGDYELDDNGITINGCPQKKW